MPLIEEFDDPIEVYADIDMADLYLQAAFHGDNWDAQSDDQKGKALVTATRLLDRQIWIGDKTYPDQELQWPRINTGIDEVDVDSSAVPTDIVNASIEIALALVNGSTVQDDPNTTQKLSSLSAGSVSLVYYHGSDPTTPQRFPQIVYELTRKYLAGSTPAISGVATGTDGCSITSKDFGVNQGF